MSGKARADCHQKVCETKTAGVHVVRAGMVGESKGDTVAAAAVAVPMTQDDGSGDESENMAAVDPGNVILPRVGKAGGERRSLREHQ